MTRTRHLLGQWVAGSQLQLARLWLRKQRRQCSIAERIAVQPATRSMSPDRRDWPQFGVRHLRDFELGLSRTRK
jgi:hypothetical protein